MKKTILVLITSYCFTVAQSQDKINIFSPDPMTTSGAVHDEGFDNPANLYIDEYVEVELIYSSIENDKIFGMQVNIMPSEDPPIVGLDQADANGNFLVNRDDHRFKAYNAYYHADKFITFLEDFNIIADIPTINIDPYTNTGTNGGTVEMNENGVTGVKLVKHYNEDMNPDTESVDMAEDAFGIAYVMAEVYMTYTSMALTNNASEMINMDMPDIKIGLKDYLAQSYVHSLGAMDHLCYNWGGQPSIVDQGEQRTTDFSLLPGIDKRTFNPGQLNDSRSSQWLSSTLMAIQAGTSKQKCDTWVMNSLTPADLNLINFEDDDPLLQIDDMYQYIWYLYDKAIAMEGTGADQFLPEELCLIYNEFSLTYGENFWSYRDAPQLNAIDVFIKDNADDIGIEGHEDPIYNSPSIWNRQENDGFQNTVHQEPSASGIDYLHVRIDANICHIQNALNTNNASNDLKLRVHYNLKYFTYAWPATWNSPDHHDPAGDLLGVLDMKTLTWMDDNGDPMPQTANGTLPFSFIKNNGSNTIISLPYNVPPFRNWAPLKFGKNATLGIHTIIESQGFDPLDLLTLTSSVSTNTKNKNNIALKNTVVLARQYCCPTSNDPKFYTPIKIPPPPPTNPVNPDTDYTIKLVPSTHDPNPVEVSDPDYEPLPYVFNDYFDYGQVVIALDDDLFAAWQSGGGRGQGFTINSDNEIEVTGRNFILEGLPYPSQGLESIIGFNFYSNTLPGRTGFDFVQSTPADKEIGRVHVEVREPLSANRNNLDNKNEPSIVIYPNPIDGNTLNISNISQVGNYTIFGLNGKSYSTGKLVREQRSIDVSALEDGIYFLRFAMENGKVETKKLIKINN